MSKPAFSNAKFEATGETKEWFGRTLHRISAVADIAAIGIAAGTLGGWIEKEDSLSVYGNAWVSGDAQVSGDARVYGNAWVSGNARVYGNARVSGFLPYAHRSDGYAFVVTATPDGPRLIAGCRYFTFDDADKHWRETRGGTPLGDETMDILELLKNQAERHGLMEPVKAEESA